MSIIKVIEVMSNSTKSWEDAAKNGVTHAAQTVHNIRSVWIQDKSAIVGNGQIIEFRVTLKLSFEVEQN